MKKKGFGQSLGNRSSFEVRQLYQEKTLCADGSPKICQKYDQVVEGTTTLPEVTSISLPGTSAQDASTSGSLVDALGRNTLVNVTDALVSLFKGLV